MKRAASIMRAFLSENHFLVFSDSVVDINWNIRKVILAKTFYFSPQHHLAKF